MPSEDAHELVTIQPDEFEAQPELPRGAKLHKASDPDDDQVPSPDPDPEE
jgi:hypothetical protein